MPWRKRKETHERLTFCQHRLDKRDSTQHRCSTPHLLNSWTYNPWTTETTHVESMTGKTKQSGLGFGVGWGEVGFDDAHKGCAAVRIDESVFSKDGIFERAQ